MLYTIKNEFLRVDVAAKGAELQSILAADGTQYLWQGDATYWADRALNIFPYVARLTEGKYEMDGELHEMGIHGFAWLTEFACVENTDTKLVMELCDSEDSYRQYPRKFRLRIIYTLEGKTLTTRYEVENRDERAMYFGLGGHPGFNVPLAEGKKFEDYKITFEAPCEPARVGFTPACFLDGTSAPFKLENGTELALHHDMFDEDAIVLTDMTRDVTLSAQDDPHKLRVRFAQMPYLGIWHRPKTDAPYVCIEPWLSLPSTQDEIAVFEKQKDLYCLEAGKTYCNEWQMDIEF